MYDVIRRRVVVDLDSISPASDGDLSDGDPTRDSVGVMYDRRGAITHPIVLVRSTQDGRGQWLIEGQAAIALDAAYSTLTRSWAADRLPAPLLDPGPFGLPRWKWIGIIVGAPLAWIIVLALGWLARRAALAVTRRTQVWDSASTAST